MYRRDYTYHVVKYFLEILFEVAIKTWSYWMKIIENGHQHNDIWVKPNTLLRKNSQLRRKTPLAELGGSRKRVLVCCRFALWVLVQAGIDFIQ